MTLSYLLLLLWTALQRQLLWIFFVEEHHPLTTHPHSIAHAARQDSTLTTSVSFFWEFALDFSPHKILRLLQIPLYVPSVGLHINRSRDDSAYLTTSKNDTVLSFCCDWTNTSVNKTMHVCFELSTFELKPVESQSLKDPEVSTWSSSLGKKYVKNPCVIILSRIIVGFISFSALLQHSRFFTVTNGLKTYTRRAKLKRSEKSRSRTRLNNDAKPNEMFAASRSALNAAHICNPWQL